MMPTEDIDGPGGATVRVIVARGTVSAGSPRDPSDLTKYDFRVGETLDLARDDADRLHAIGMVDYPGESRGGLASGNVTGPAIGPGHVGLVESVKR